MKKKYLDFMLNEQDSSTAVAPTVHSKDGQKNSTNTTGSINNDASGEEKPTSDQVLDDTKKDDSNDSNISNFDNITGEAIIKKIHNFWINNIITENEVNFSGNTLKILYLKQKNPKYSKYKQVIDDTISHKTSECRKRLDESDSGDMFFYINYPVKLIKKGLGVKPSIISFFESKTDNNYNIKIKNIINSNDYFDNSKLDDYQKYLRLDEFELLYDIDESHTYIYEGQPVEFKIEDGAIKMMVNADTNKQISLVDKDNNPVFDITKLKKEDDSDKSNTTTTTTTTVYAANTNTTTTTVSATNTTTTTVSATTTEVTTISLTTINRKVHPSKLKNLVNKEDYKKGGSGKVHVNAVDANKTKH